MVDSCYDALTIISALEYPIPAQPRRHHYQGTMASGLSSRDRSLAWFVDSNC
jgi:hypothetical protein